MYKHAELIVVVGQNPGTNHPRMLSALEKGKPGRQDRRDQPAARGRRDPVQEPAERRGIGKGTPLADGFLQIRLNGDLALFAA